MCKRSTLADFLFEKFFTRLNFWKVFHTTELCSRQISTFTKLPPFPAVPPFSAKYCQILPNWENTAKNVLNFLQPNIVKCWQILHKCSHSLAGTVVSSQKFNCLLPTTSSSLKSSEEYQLFNLQGFGRANVRSQLNAI